MKRVPNIEVIQRWKTGMSGRASNLGTDGRNLFSYGFKIGYTNAKNERVALDYSSQYTYFFSTHMYKHMSYAKNCADKIEKAKWKKTTAVGCCQYTFFCPLRGQKLFYDFWLTTKIFYVIL